MRPVGIYKNLEKILDMGKITRQELLTLFDFNKDTMTRKLAGRSKLSLEEATIIRDYIQNKLDIKFDLEDLFKTK